MSINQILSKFKKYFLLSFGIVIIGFFIFIIISPSSIFPLTFSDFFIPFIALMIYLLIWTRLIKIVKNKTKLIVLICLTILSIFLMIFMDYNSGKNYYHQFEQMSMWSFAASDLLSKYLLVFSLIWFIPLSILWYGINKFRELNKFGKFGCLSVIISILGQFTIYLYGPCLGIFGHLNKYLCPESAISLFYILGLIWIFIIIGLLCIIFGKKRL